MTLPSAEISHDLARSGDTVSVGVCFTRLLNTSHRIRRVPVCTEYAGSGASIEKVNGNVRVPPRCGPSFVVTTRVGVATGAGAVVGAGAAVGAGPGAGVGSSVPQAKATMSNVAMAAITEPRKRDLRLVLKYCMYSSIFPRVSYLIPSAVRHYTLPYTITPFMSIWFHLSN